MAQQLLINRIFDILKNGKIEDWRNLVENQENLVIIIKSQIGSLTRRLKQALTNELIMEAVQTFIQLEDDSSVSSLGNIADESSIEDLSMDFSRRSFNAPGWQRLPASPATPTIYRRRHVALPQPENPDPETSTEPQTDATLWSDKSHDPAPASPEYMGSQDFSVNQNPFNNGLIENLDPANAVPVAQSTFILYLTPVSNLFNDQEVPLSLQEEADFNAMADGQLNEIGSPEINNYNSYVQLNETE